MVALGVSTLCFMLPWQFAQFVLLTQVNAEQVEVRRAAGNIQTPPASSLYGLPLNVSWSLLHVVCVLIFQVASLFASYILGYLAAAKMQSVLVTHMVRWTAPLLPNPVVLTRFAPTEADVTWSFPTFLSAAQVVFKGAVLPALAPADRERRRFSWNINDAA